MTEGASAARSPCRVVLDTNAVIDWLVFDDPSMAAFAKAVNAGEVQLVCSGECIGELERALGYAALKLDTAAQAQLLARYLATARRIDPPVHCGVPQLPRCEDPDDQKFLELAVCAEARALLTRDKALLKLATRTREIFGLWVLAPAQFEQAIAPRP